MSKDNEEARKQELEIKARIAAAELKGVTCLAIFEELVRNPNNDPFYEVTAKLLEDQPSKQERILLNFIDALSVANLRFANRIRQQAQSHDETLNNVASGVLAPPEHNVVRRGFGALARGFQRNPPGGK